MDWDDLRFVLAVARCRSAARAADELGVNQTTVSRRLAALEERLAVRLFDRSPTGWVPTAAGATVLEHAGRMHAEALALERRVAGEDTRLAGRLRVTLSCIVATYLLLPRLAEFRNRHPEIALELVIGDEARDLDTRDADVALRITDRAPEHLVGRRIAGVGYAVYGSRRYLETHPDPTAPDVDVLTQVPSDTPPRWVARALPRARLALSIDSVASLVAAVRAGLGLALLPCFVGEQEPELARAPVRYDDEGWALWVLSHADLRSTARVKAFREFVAGILADARPLLAPSAS